MFHLQVTLSDFQCRRRQSQLNEDFLIVFRFGSIKLDIKISSSYGQFIGGKTIVLDILPQQLQQMFLTYALGMFLQNKSDKFFSLLSLQNLHCSDIVSGQEVYFYNDSQEIVYSANFSLVFNDFKNPRLLNNKGAIENYKTFDQMFKKPAVPTAQVSRQQLGKTTMSSFLYGNRHTQNVNGVKGTLNRPASGKPKNSTSVKGKKNNKNMTKTASNQFQKQNYGATLNNHSSNQMAQTFFPQQNINIYRPFEQQDYQQTDINPPMMQFTNTITDPQKGLGLLKTQLQQISSPQSVKLMTAFQAKNGFSRKAPKNILNKDAKNARIKIQQQFMKTKNNSKNLGQLRGVDYNLTTNSNKQLSTMTIKVDRQQLRSKAKQQLATYQGNSNIKIPILKDGKYEFVQLSQLSEQEIKKFAQKQKQLQFEEQMRKQMQRQLQKKDKQNQRLKRQLQEKQRLMKKKQQQARRQKQQLLKKQQQQQYKYSQQQQAKNKHYSQSQLQQKSQNEQKNSEDYSQSNYDDSQMNKSSPQHKEQKHSPKYQQSNQQQQEDNYYQSDFESMASGLKQSKNSINSSQKLKGQQSYNQSYDPDFQSYSQSFLDSKLKLSASQISDNNYYQYKKR